MNERLSQILAIIEAAATLAGEDRAAKLLEVFRVGAAEYQEITGKPVEWETIKHIPEIT